MITEVLKPGDIASVMSHPIIVAYWPLLLGGPFVFLATGLRQDMRILALMLV